VFLVYRKVIESWVRKHHAELQARFDSYADTYRAQLDRLMAARESRALERAEHPVAAD
jgi:hypothetical protein